MSERPLDTSPEVHALYRELLRSRTGAARVRMASDMFASARRLVLASLPEAVRADPQARSAALLRRLYGRDLPPTLIDNILAHLSRRAR